MSAHHQPKGSQITSSEQDSKKSLESRLVILLPLAIGVSAVFSAWRLLVAVAVVSGVGWAWKFYQQWQQQRRVQLNAIFYQLIQEHNGRLTALDLAMRAHIRGKDAQQFLDLCAKEFSAYFEVTDTGGVVYCFSSVKLPERDSSLVGSIPLSAEPLPPPLNQSQLALRFGVHPTTISSHKSKPDFTDWSRTKDPSGISWTYAPATKQFFPQDGDR